MTQEQYNRAVGISARLEGLAKVKKAIKNTSEHRLWYARKYPVMWSSKWDTVSEYVMRNIGDILDRHDRMIREEIDEEIEKLKKEIETL